MKKRQLGLLTSFTFLAACAGGLPPAETTPEGLERVPSRPEGGVYRKLDADFTRYKRLMIEPLTVAFIKDWRRQHRDVSDAEISRVEAETIQAFREVFVETLVDEGPFELAEVREADVMVVVLRIFDLNIPAPETEADTGHASFSPYKISMEMSGELRDGITGEILLRVNMIEPANRQKTDHMGGAARLTNAREIRDSLEKWSRLVREAIDVAKASKPR
jgi:hypothetical protein